MVENISLYFDTIASPTNDYNSEQFKTNYTYTR